MNGGFLNPADVEIRNHECEYLVIGSGAGGSVAAYELAQAGKNVIVVEEGPHYRTEDFTSKPSEMTAALYREGGITPFWGKPPIAFVEGRCVGGGTTINGGLLWRTPDFVLEDWQKRFGLDGYSYDDLTSHFEKIEKMLQVGYLPEKFGNLDSEAYAEGARKLGWNVVPVPRAGGHICKNSNLCATGCPTGAKKSTPLTYLKDAVKNGATVFSGCKVTKIIHKKGRISSVKANVQEGDSINEIDISAKNVIFAGGTIQTPFILQKNNMSAVAGKTFQFHINLKLVALFDREINAENGTIFTQQVQEFLQDGFLFMASNFKKNYVSMALSHFGNHTINRVLENDDKAGLFVAQIRPKSVGKIYTLLAHNPITTYASNTEDHDLMKFALLKSCELLFKSGAVEIFLPIAGTQPVKNNQAVEKTLEKFKAEDVELVSVHAMSSCPMGIDEKSVVDMSGQIRGFSNAFIVDASVLPTNIGESPQGTIMAFAHEIMLRHLSK